MVADLVTEFHKDVDSLKGSFESLIESTTKEKVMGWIHGSHEPDNGFEAVPYEAWLETHSFCKTQGVCPNRWSEKTDPLQQWMAKNHPELGNWNSFDGWTSKLEDVHGAYISVKVEFYMMGTDATVGDGLDLLVGVWTVTKSDFVTREVVSSATFRDWFINDDECLDVVVFE